MDSLKQLLMTAPKSPFSIEEGAKFLADFNTRYPSVFRENDQSNMPFTKEQLASLDRINAFAQDIRPVIASIFKQANEAFPPHEETQKLAPGARETELITATLILEAAMAFLVDAEIHNFGIVTKRSEFSDAPPNVKRSLLIEYVGRTLQSTMAVVTKVTSRMFSESQQTKH